MKQIRLLKWFAFWEATVFLALLIATALQSVVNDAGALFVLGCAHAFVFSGYVILALIVRARLRWNLLTTLSIVIAGFIPGGGYVVERWALNGARIDRHIDDLNSSWWSPF